MKTWVKNILEANRKETAYSNIEAKRDEKEPLETQFPEDLFSLFNQQVTLLANQLKGDMFITVVRIWMNYLQDIFEEKADDFVQVTKLDVILKYPVEINDFNKLALNLNDNKAEVIGFVEGEQVEKVNQYFIETAKVISKSTDKLLEGLVQLMFTRIEDSIVHTYFE